MTAKLQLSPAATSTNLVAPGMFSVDTSVGVDSRGFNSASSLSDPASASRSFPSQLVGRPRASLSLTPHVMRRLSAVSATVCMPPQANRTMCRADESLASR